MPGPADDRLARLFAGLYGNRAASVTPLTDEDVIAALSSVDQLVEDPVNLIQRGFPGQSLSIRQLGVIRLSRELLRDYFAQPAYHPELGQALLHASGRVIAEALPADGWLLRPHHPIHTLFSLVEQVAAGWYPELPRAGETVQLLCGWLKQALPAEQRLAAARQWSAELQQRQERITARVAESEYGVLRLNYIRQTAARSLNRLLAGRQVPDFMAEAIALHWAGAFQWTLLHHGEQSPLWQKLVRGVGLLVWSVQPEAADPSHRPKLTRVIEQIKADLMPVLADVVADESLRQQLREQVDMAHHCQLHGKPVEYRPVPVMADGAALDDAGVSEALLSEVAAVQIGDWFTETVTGRRLRLSLKLDEYQQLLFVNQLGMKLASASFEEFAWQFSSAQISALVAPVPLHEWAAERLATLADQYRERQRSREREYRADRDTAGQRGEAQERELGKALTEARKIAETEQRQAAEASALKMAEAEVEKARREAVAAGHGASEAQRRQRARLLVSGLSMGVWLTFHDLQGVQVRRKLAVVLPSSGKYIFVDRLGTDKYEMLREDLVAGIAAGAIDVVRKDSRFDDALTRVVDGIRQDRGWGDDGPTGSTP